MIEDKKVLLPAGLLRASASLLSASATSSILLELISLSCLTDFCIVLNASASSVLILVALKSLMACANLLTVSTFSEEKMEFLNVSSLMPRPFF